MRLRKGLFLLPFVLLEAGCGLPDSYFLYPPSAESLMNESTSYCQIAGTSRASDILVDFRGYELYYKLTSAYNSADIIYGSSTYTYNDLVSAGFYRVCRGPGSVSALSVDTAPGTASAPLIDISTIDPDNIGANFTVNIYFNESASAGLGFTDTKNVSYYAYCPPATSTAEAGMEIRRYVQADTSLGNFCKTFAPDSYYSFTNYAAGDTDGVTTTMRTAAYNNGGILYVMLYAVSYGKADDGTYLRSSPTYLGYTKLYVISQ
jgi:hypothetical protein